MKKLLFLVLLGFMSLLLVGCDQLASLTGNITTKENNTSDSDVNTDYQNIGNQIDSLSKLTGYEIELKVKGEYTNQAEQQAGYALLTLGKKDNALWVKTTEGGAALLKDNGNTHIFSTNENNEFEYQLTTNSLEVSGVTFDSLFEVFNSYLLTFNEYKKDSVKLESTTVAGRKCTHYQLDNSVSIITLIYDFYVDDELGITLKFDVTGNYDGQEGNASFEVTTFNFNPTMPSLHLPEELNLMLNYSEWPNNELANKLPKIDFGTGLMVIIMNGSLEATLSATEAEALAYAQSVASMYPSLDASNLSSESIYLSGEIDGSEFFLSYNEQMLVIGLRN